MRIIRNSIVAPLACQAVRPRPDSAGQTAGIRPPKSVWRILSARAQSPSARVRPISAARSLFALRRKR
jgi:hypothetical protein